MQEQLEQITLSSLSFLDKFSVDQKKICLKESINECCYCLAIAVVESCGSECIATDINSVEVISTFFEEAQRSEFKNSSHFINVFKVLLTHGMSSTKKSSTGKKSIAPIEALLSKWWNKKMPKLSKEKSVTIVACVYHLLLNGGDIDDMLLEAGSSSTPLHTAVELYLRTGINYNICTCLLIFHYYYFGFLSSFRGQNYSGRLHHHGNRQL